MKIDSSSTYTNDAHSSAGFSGLMSGIDTDNLVKTMLSGIQNKIDKQNQQKQVLEWKQEFYRDVITDINSFKDKYLDIVSESSLKLTSTFNKAKVESTSDAVTVKPSSSGATITDFDVQVAQLATATKATSGVASSMAISTTGTPLSFDRNVKFTVNEIEVNIDLAGTTDAALTKEELQDRLNTGLGGTGITASIGDDGYITFDSANEFSVSGSRVGMAILGFQNSTVSSSDEGSLKGYANPAYSKINTVNSQLDFTLDGVKKTFTLKEGESVNSDAFKNQLANAFGTAVYFDGNNIKVDGVGRRLSITGDKETMKSVFNSDSATVSSQIRRTDKLSTIAGIVFDVDGNGTVDINGKSISFSQDDTIGAFMNKVNTADAGVTMAYNDLSNRFSITSNSTGAGFNINVDDSVSKIFDSFKFSFTGTDLNVEQGKNSIASVNGVIVERLSNNFVYNGVDITLNSLTGDYSSAIENGRVKDGVTTLTAAGYEEEVKITSKRDNTEVLSIIKSFVEDYNTMIDKLNKLTHQESTYKKYPPLTEEQKKEMTEKEVELWDEKAKTGLLRNDADITGFLQDMRSAMYTKQEGQTYVLSQTGVDTSSNWKEFGKLVLNEDKFSDMLDKDITGVLEVFTGTNGLASRLSDICDKAANVSSGSQGELVKVAGVKGRGSEKQNMIFEKMEAINAKLVTLNSLYEKRKERYWDQFDNMETNLSKINAQSSWLSQN